QLIAIEKGSRPALLELSGPPWDSPPEDVILQLGPEPLRVEGIVLSADDKPVADAKVWIADGTSFGVLGNVPLQREAMMAGAPLPKEGIDFLGTGPTEDGKEDFGNHMPLQAPNAILNFATTNAEGRFELPGLDDRTYTLHVLGPNLGSAVIVPEVQAGRADLTLRMDPALSHSSFSGTVQLASGEPVSGVLIYPFLPSVDAQLRVFGGSSGVTRWFAGSSRTTDEEGRFEFGPLLNLGVNFYIESDDILPTYGSIEDVVDPKSHAFEVVARLHAQAELLDPNSADELAVFDSEGVLKIIRTMRASGHTTWERIPFERGRTAPFALTSEAVELRLYKAGEVIATHSLNLRPGELNQLRY
ncbi:MAG: carboxypeptidase-like regulatory domain-containing protein, partial [Planctomycetota bacterium]